MNIEKMKKLIIEAAERDKKIKKKTIAQFFVVLVQECGFFDVIMRSETELVVSTATDAEEICAEFFNKNLLFYVMRKMDENGMINDGKMEKQEKAQKC